jgi:hypothetical protein
MEARHAFPWRTKDWKGWEKVFDRWKTAIGFVALALMRG